MQDFIRGQRTKLSQLAPNTTRFTLEVRAQSALPVFDFVCFGIDAKGQLSDDRFMVFFNQKTAPNDAIKLENLGDKSATFAFDLNKLSASIVRLVFTLSVDGAGAMRDLGASELTLKSNGQTLMRYAFSGADFVKEGALMLAEVYQKDGVWRVWASGQGFAGDLGALLAHFGGEVVEESTPTSSPVSIPTPPAPPVSDPLSLSAPANPTATPPAVAAVVAVGELQKTIDAATTGATIRLPRGEYRGPIRIARALTIEGEGAVIWAGNGPVVAVVSANVTLRGIQIEVTDGSSGGASDVALKVEGAAPTLDRVEVRGRVVGMNSETADDWQLPVALDLGEFAPRALNSWRFTLKVPVDCQLKTSVSGLQIQPTQLGAGAHEVEIVANGIGPDTFLAGQIEVQHAGLVRPIPLSGRTARANANLAAAQSKRVGGA